MMKTSLKFLIRLFIVIVLRFSKLASQAVSIIMGLPDYIVADVDNMEAIENTALRQIAEPIKFPLSEEDETIFDLLEKKFDTEGTVGLGLAAPQIGFSKRAFIMKVGWQMAKMKKCQEFPKTVLINPSYEAVTPLMEGDFEQCFSVYNRVGEVMRYKSIKYKYQNLEGNSIEGYADGLTARVFQHEADHLDGKLFVDHVDKSKLMTVETYMQELMNFGFAQSGRTT